MRKITCKQVTTIATYDVYNVLLEEVKKDSRMFEGKVSYKEVLAELKENNIPYINGSLEVVIETCQFRYPVDVLEEVINVATNIGFYTEDNEKPEFFKFPYYLLCQEIVNPLKIGKVVILDGYIDFDDSEKKEEFLKDSSCFLVDEILIPTGTYQYLRQEYSQEPKRKRIYERGHKVD